MEYVEKKNQELKEEEHNDLTLASMRLANDRINDCLRGGQMSKESE
jgi:hypothetical protein